MLRQTFIEMTQKYTDDIQLPEKLWDEVERNYSNKKRHYHTLIHLDNLYKQLTGVRNHIEDWDTILFSLFYHDIIYNPSSADNEEKSARLAKERLQLLSFPADKISKCVSQILATKGHSKSSDNDTNLFTDADLSILGENWDSYSDYFKKIRKEYSIYPDFVYNSGRKKVLNHFMNMESIYKTSPFSHKFEKSARENLTKELRSL